MTSNDKNEAGVVGAASASKKPYRSPVMHVYGDVRAMTMSTANGNTADGMTGAGMTKSFP